MSVYKPAKSRFWQYDFVLQGRRFHGSTGQVARRAAEAAERRIREKAGRGELDGVATMTLDQAAGRYWKEVGIRRGDAVDVERRLERLIALFPKGTVLGDIDQRETSTAVQKRRGQTMRRGKSKDARTYLPSPATVNRDVIETLRPILKRAKTHWTAKGERHGLPEIDWSALRLREPRAQSRIYSERDRRAWVDACEDDLGLALDMLLTYGLRFGELFFPLDALTLDTDEPTLTLQKGRKRDTILYLPLRRDHARDLAARVSRAHAAKLPHIWFRPRAVPKRGKPDIEALTYGQVEYRISKAADAVGITGARRIHGARHHAGSTILKKTANLKSVQALLGHASIHSSQRYAHVLAADLRAALDDDESRNSPEPRPTPDAQSKAG